MGRYRISQSERDGLDEAVLQVVPALGGWRTSEEVADRVRAPTTVTRLHDFRLHVVRALKRLTERGDLVQGTRGNRAVWTADKVISAQASA